MALQILLEKMNESNRFPKSERLSQQSEFDALYKDSKKVHVFPLLGFWRKSEHKTVSPIQIAFSAPKKHYKKASERNRIKRILREAYRTQNEQLKSFLLESDKSITVSILILKTDNTSYDLLRGQMMLLLRKIEVDIKHAE